jgi:hypothetical protein
MNFAQRRRFLWILLLGGIALIAVVANATTMVRLRFEELAQKSSAIARLRCVSTKSLWDAGEIRTETRFAVVDREKGSLEETVTVRMLGGNVEHVHSRVEGVPTFRAGEEVYLFLWGRNGEAYRVLGWSQGTFRIAPDAKAGAEVVSQDSSGAAVFDPGTHTFRSAGIGRMELGEFQQKLRRLLRSTTP